MAIIVVRIKGNVLINHRSFVRFLLIMGVTEFRSWGVWRLFHQVFHVASGISVLRMVFIAFFRFRRSVRAFVIVIRGAIFRGGDVTVSLFVVFLSGIFLVIFMFFDHGFLHTRYFRSATLPIIGRTRLLIHLFRHLFRITVDRHAISFRVSLISFNLFILISISVCSRFAFVYSVIFLGSFSVRVLGTFTVRRLLSRHNHAVSRIEDRLMSFARPRANFRVFAFPLLSAVVISFQGAQALFRSSFRPGLVSLCFDYRGLCVQR